MLPGMTVCDLAHVVRRLGWRLPICDLRALKPLPDRVGSCW
jgi:hypothetical protein